MEEIKDQVANSLIEAATSYYEEALTKYLVHKDKGSFDYPQVAIGNFCVAIELTAKALIAKSCFPMIFPKEKANKYFQLLHYPNIVPKDEVKAMIEEIHFSKVDTIDFQETMNVLKKIYPKETEAISTYFHTTREIRNSSLHSYVFKTSKRALFKVAFVSISLMKLLDHTIKRPGLAEFDTEDIIENFENTEVKIAQDAIENARNIAKELKTDECDIVNYVFETFSEIDIKCPICKQEARLFGAIDEQWNQNAYDEPPQLESIAFIPQSIDCPSCKLKLSGPMQLKEIALNNHLDFSEKLDEYLEKLSQAYYEKYEQDDDPHW